MKRFFGCTFMGLNELMEMGVNYPIKLEYFKTSLENVDNSMKYGIEVIKTSYIEKEMLVENYNMPNLITDENKIERILEILKYNKVTPISAQYVVEDLLKE